MPDAQLPNSIETWVPTETAPGWRTPSRGRIVLDFQENGERIHSSDDGWLTLDDNGWVHFFGDEVGHWQSWPPQHVVCIDWGSDALRTGADHG